MKDFFSIKAFLLCYLVSGKVLAQLWSSVLSACLRMPQEKDLHEKVVTVACSSLVDHHQEVNRSLLIVLSMLKASSGLFLVIDNESEYKT